MRQFWVFLKVGESLEAFYEDMETPGGSLHIPNRQVSVANRGGISPGTLYELTTEEALEVMADERVAEVIPVEVAERIILREEQFFDNRTFTKYYNTSKLFTRFDGTSGFMHSNERLANWGALRHVEETNRPNWEQSDSPNESASVKFSANGTNVDVIIFETHSVYELNEYSSQFVKYDWGQLFNEASAGDIGNWTYDYDELQSVYGEHNSHPTISASLIAGEWFGIADKCNLYAYSSRYVGAKLEDLGYTSGDGIHSSSLFWNVLRTFHANKPVNPATGVKNPTIVNVSLGSMYQFDAQITHGSFRGVTYADTPQDEAALIAQGVSVAHNSDYTSPSDFRLSSPAGITNVDLAISEGIHVVTSAGNSNSYIDVSGGQDYDNYVVLPGLPDEIWYRVHHHRGDYFITGGGIAVGALSSTGAAGAEKKCSFSSWGPRVDVYACGDRVTSSVAGPLLNEGENFPLPYQKSQEYFDVMGTAGAGTSYSCPQVTAMCALYLQIYPRTTPAELKEWVRNTASTGQMFDGGGDFPTDTNDRLSFAGNDTGRVLRWINHKSVEGNLSFNTFGERPQEGTAYPRTKIRRRG